MATSVTQRVSLRTLNVNSLRRRKSYPYNNINNLEIQNNSNSDKCQHNLLPSGSVKKAKTLLPPGLLPTELPKLLNDSSTTSNITSHTSPLMNPEEVTNVLTGNSFSSSTLLNGITLPNHSNLLSSVATSATTTSATATRHLIPSYLRRTSITTNNPNNPNTNNTLLNQVRVNGTTDLSNVVYPPSDNDDDCDGSSLPSLSLSLSSSSSSTMNSNISPTTTENTTTYPSYSSDLIVVLDMDECLIHSRFQTDDTFYRQLEDRPSSDSYNSNNNNNTEQDSSTPQVDTFQIILPDGDLVHVHKRPNLDLFLQHITRRYETYIFTAAMEIYAKPVLDVLDPHKKLFQHRFYREDCVWDGNLGVYVKDLNKAFQKYHHNVLSREQHIANNSFVLNEERIVLVDNNPYSFLANPSNGILVSNFYNDPNDDTLSAVMELLEELEGEGDVRPILDRRFGLKDALGELQTTSTWR